MFTKEECIEGFFKRILSYSKIETKLIHQLRIDLEAVYEQGKMQTEREMLCNTQEWWEAQNADLEWLDAHGEGSDK